MSSFTTISDLFGKERLIKQNSRSQREELIEYFYYKLLPSWGEGQKKKGRNIPLSPRYINFRLSHLKHLSDLFHLKSICDDAEHRGHPWSKVFWGSIKPR